MTSTGRLTWLRRGEYDRPFDIHDKPRALPEQRSAGQWLQGEVASLSHLGAARPCSGRRHQTVTRTLTLLLPAHHAAVEHAVDGTPEQHSTAHHSTAQPAAEFKVKLPT
jgi:hypothetical protein